MGSLTSLLLFLLPPSHLHLPLYNNPLPKYHCLEDHFEPYDSVQPSLTPYSLQESHGFKQFPYQPPRRASCPQSPDNRWRIYEWIHHSISLRQQLHGDSLAGNFNRRTPRAWFRPPPTYYKRCEQDGQLTTDRPAVRPTQPSWSGQPHDSEWRSCTIPTICKLILVIRLSRRMHCPSPHSGALSTWRFANLFVFQTLHKVEIVSIPALPTKSPPRLASYIGR